MSASPFALRDADIREVVELIADTVEGCEQGHRRSELLPRPDQAVTASVVIHGSTSAVVSIACSRRLSTHIASLMFGRPEVTDEEVHDALGEVVNMVGGNLKALLPSAPSAGRLSLPQVREGEASSAGATPTNQLQLSWGDEAMTVRVFPFVDDGA